MPAKVPDRSISPLPNPPTGHSLKLPNKLTNTSRSQSPSVGGKPPKKKKKTTPAVSEVTVKEDVPVVAPVTQEPMLLPSDATKSKLDTSKQPTHSAAMVSSLSSSLSSSDSELEEVTAISMPTIPPSNLGVAAATAHGNNVGVTKRGRSSEDGSSSSSGSDSGGSSSGSISESDEVMLDHILVEINNEMCLVVCFICPMFMCIA